MTWWCRKTEFMHSDEVVLNRVHARRCKRDARRPWCSKAEVHARWQPGVVVKPSTCMETKRVCLQVEAWGPCLPFASCTRVMVSQNVTKAMQKVTPSRNDKTHEMIQLLQEVTSCRNDKTHEMIKLLLPGPILNYMCSIKNFG
eukprot:1158019-Pelagomonas_calceolata.AAC.2